jgi:hypothetical protein
LSSQRSEDAANAAQQMMPKMTASDLAARADYVKSIAGSVGGNAIGLAYDAWRVEIPAAGVGLVTLWAQDGFILLLQA